MVETWITVRVGCALTPGEQRTSSSSGKGGSKKKNVLIYGQVRKHLFQGFLSGVVAD